MDDFKDPLSEDKSGCDDFDDILSGEFFPGIASQDTPVAAPSDSLQKSDEEKSSDDGDRLPPVGTFPALRGEEFPAEYLKMVNRIRLQYDNLPVLDYDAIYKKISDLSIKSCPTPTLQILNDEIQKVQGAKDRLSEIFVDTLKCHTLKKRVVDILVDSWGKFTTEKNADGRKGDASFRLSDFLVDFAIVEGLLKACTHILRNLDSLHDSLSRRITIVQLTMKLHDVGRGALPDFDFDRTVPGDSSQLFDDNQQFSNQGSELELENF